MTFKKTEINFFLQYFRIVPKRSRIFQSQDLFATSLSEPIPTVVGANQGYAMNKSPVNHIICLSITPRMVLNLNTAIKENKTGNGNT